MSEANDNQNEVADPLRPDRCPDCGYLFTGLPDAGTCPECGIEYDPETIVLYGYKTGHRSAVTLPFSNAMAVLLAIAAIACIASTLFTASMAINIVMVAAFGILVMLQSRRMFSAR